MPRPAYTVPQLTRDEVTAQRDSNPMPDECPECAPGFPVDHWPSSVCDSSFRRGPDGTERLFRAHCTCGRCF